MTLEVKQSTQFEIRELTLVVKGGSIDITKIFEEINLYDSLFLPVISGNILITDAIGLSSKLLFDGSEVLLVDIAKNADSDIASFKKAFRVYKQSNRQNNGLNSEAYVLHFVSDDLIYSDQQKINQSFEGTYSYIIEKILENYLKIPASQAKGIYENSVGIKSIVIPNLKPLEAIEWCAKRAVDINQAPNFMFYQNSIGYNFASLSTLLTQENILDIQFSPKNLSDSNPASEISSARGLEVVEQNDNIKKGREGVNAGQFIGFDPITRTVAKKNISFGDIYSKIKHANETPDVSIIKNRDGLDSTQAYDSKKTVSIFGVAQQISKYIKQNDPTSLSKIENLESFLFQRKAFISMLMNKRVKIAMPGNFQLTSGFNIYLEAPTFGAKEKDGDNQDKSLSGKYLIVASRQIIGYDKHETIIEVATTSTERDFVAVSSSSQVEELKEYE
jgi:hypothetical protein